MLIAFLQTFFRLFFSLRYKVELVEIGENRLNDIDPKKPILFLPNHSAMIDPILIGIHLWPQYRMRPLIVEYMAQNVIISSFNWLIHPLPIPDFADSVNQLKIKKAKESFKKIIEGLKQGERFLLYPTGSLKSTGEELLRGASAAHSIITEYKEVNVVLIRSTGLWGSIYSRAFEGKTPDPNRITVKAFFILLKNFIFFTPRRKVTIEIETNPPDFPRNGPRPQFNRYLENWYNRYKDSEGNIHQIEPLNLVSYSFWRQDLPIPFKPKSQMGPQGIPISDETKNRVYGEIRKILDNPDLSITPEMSLAFDLALDSLNMADLTSYLVKNYDIENLSPESLGTVQEVLEIAEGSPREESSFRPLGVHRWPEETGRPSPQMAEGKTIPEAFLNVCKRMGPFAASGDDITGVLSYQKMKRAVLILAEYFKTVPEDKIGVLLPASVGAFITILAIQFAGKTPVMVNWTLGPRYLEEMMKISGAKKVITSWKFMDRLSNVDFGNLTDQMELLEEIRKTLSFKMKLRGALLSHFSPSFLLKKEPLKNIDPNSPAVILFTSGTESVPKCVPLSHANILANNRASLEALEDVRAEDSVYSVLPPFHSFGYSSIGMLTLLCGVRVAFYPNPTDGPSMAEGIARWKSTHFPAAPSFINRLFASATDDQLKSIRVYISGAEKASKELYNRIEQMTHRPKLLDGYGVTECSAAVTLTRPSKPAKGVGTLLNGYEFSTIHPETLAPIPEGKEGEICLRGPSVFNGYLNGALAPFIEIDGKKWYRTGDIGYMEPDGNIFLSGRLKRFTKLGGEMISLGAVEEAIHQELVDKQRLAPSRQTLAICADERVEGKPKLILFTAIEIEKEMVNEILKTAGFSNLIKISEVKKLPELPLLATGKMDYRKLHALLS